MSNIHLVSGIKKNPNRCNINLFYHLIFTALRRKNQDRPENQNLNDVSQNRCCDYTSILRIFGPIKIQFFFFNLPEEIFQLYSSVEGIIGSKMGISHGNWK